MRSRIWSLVFWLCPLCFLLSLCSLAASADSVVTMWEDQALQAIRDTHPGPPIVARALAIKNTCMYDAWACYDSVATGPTDGSLNINTLRRPAAERTLANKQKAASFAAYRALVNLFPQPAEVTMFRNFMTSLGYDFTDTSTDVTTPQGLGNVIAAAVLAFRHHDGANQLGDEPGSSGPYTDYSGYVPVNDPDHINDPDRWQPLRVPAPIISTPPTFVVQKFITPFWQNVIPYALPSASEYDAIIPPPVSYITNPAAYRQQALQVLQYSAHLTDKQKVIAEYWADGPFSELPPGHWSLFAEYVSHRDSYGIDDDAKMFFANANAIFDASIVSWHFKRMYDYVRPVTAIHFLFAGQKILAWGGPYQGTRVINGEDWKPYQRPTVVTPPFSEYISGHSIFSAAGAETLKSYTGSDAFGASVTFGPGSSNFEGGPGGFPTMSVTLSWPTFSAAADEAGISRRYGGIHFLPGDLYSRSLGRLVGAQAWQKSLTYFNGTGAP